MSDEMKLSVIVPHYNSARLLEKLLKSIPARNDVQVIIVDDNSTKDVDVLDEIIKNAVHNVEFYTNDTHIQSAGACRNIGLQHARGKWLLFADADDYFLENMYEDISRYFEAEEDIIFFEPTSIYMDTGKTADRHIEYENLLNNYMNTASEESEFKMRIFWYSPCSKLIRKEIVDENHISFSTSLYGNDMFFSVKVGFYAKKILAVKKQIYCITRSKGSLTAIKSENAYYIRLKEMIKGYSFIWSHYETKMCEKMHVTGASCLYEALFVKKLGIRHGIKIVKMFYEAKIPICTKASFDLSYIIQGRKRVQARALRQKENVDYWVQNDI